MKKLSSFHVLLSGTACASLFVSARRLVVAGLPLLLLGNAFCAPGDLYVTAGGSTVIYKFTPEGTKTIFASDLVQPTGIVFDRTGNLFVADSAIGEILKFTPTGAKSTFASGLNIPFALAFDGAGNLYVADSFGDLGTIYKFTPAGVRSEFADGLNFVGLAFDVFGNLFATHLGPTDLSGGITKITPDGTTGVFRSGAGPGLAFGS